jgi:hypothetical protein
MSQKKKPTAEMNALLRKAGDNNVQVATAALAELATALTSPLKQGVLKGDVIGGIYQPITFAPGASIEFPLDWLAPGTEKNFIAYTIPNTGRIPERHVEGDYLMVPTFMVAASIDWALKYARDARWDIVGRAMQVLEAMFTRKNNDDGMKTIIASGASRNLVTYDDQATAGLFTKRVVALMETVMRRNAGGNSTSTNKGKLTDLWLSPEAHQDVLSWDLTQVPDVLRNQIYQNWSNDGLTKIGPVNLHTMDEIGVGQEYQKYFLDPAALGGTFPTDKVELVIGLDLQNQDSFVNPIREEVQVFEDPTFHRQRRAGVYAWAEHGFSVLDNRRVLLGAL